MRQIFFVWPVCSLCLKRPAQWFQEAVGSVIAVCRALPILSHGVTWLCMLCNVHVRRLSGRLPGQNNWTININACWSPWLYAYCEPIYSTLPMSSLLCGQHLPSIRKSVEERSEVWFLFVLVLPAPWVTRSSATSRSRQAFRKKTLPHEVLPLHPPTTRKQRDWDGISLISGGS